MSAPAQKVEFYLKILEILSRTNKAIQILFPPLATSVAVSAWTLVAISIERYFAICDPLRSRSWQTLKHAYRSIILIWITALVCMCPIAFLSKLLSTSRGKCI